MSGWRLFAFFLAGPLLVVTACVAERPCYSVAEAASHAGKEICLSAHVYDIVASPDGTRYLDVCPSDTSAPTCGFTVVSPAANRGDVGSLTALEGHDIQLRATVHSSEAGTYMVLNRVRQLHGGSEKFQPNPVLARGFSAASSSTAFHDPAMQGHHSRSSSLFRGTAH